jgi:hypothetical protein
MRRYMGHSIAPELRDHRAAWPLLRKDLTWQASVGIDGFFHSSFRECFEALESLFLPCESERRAGRHVIAEPHVPVLPLQGSMPVSVLRRRCWERLS